MNHTNMLLKITLKLNGIKQEITEIMKIINALELIISELEDISNKDDSSELLNQKEAAKILKISTYTLQAWRSIKRYNLPYIKVGKNVLYKYEDLKKFMQDRTVTNNESDSR